VCSVLLQSYFEIYGTPEYLELPELREWVNSPTDLIWPGSYYFVAATNKLSDTTAWDAIRTLLPVH